MADERQLKTVPLGLAVASGDGAVTASPGVSNRQCVKVTQIAQPTFAALRIHTSVDLVLRTAPRDGSCNPAKSQKQEMGQGVCWYKGAFKFFLLEFGVARVILVNITFRIILILCMY